MSYLHALLGSVSASGVGESPYWDKVTDYTTTSDVNYLNFNLNTSTYTGFDALWFRLMVRAGNQNASDNITVRVDSYSGANVYSNDSGMKINNGGFVYTQGSSYANAAQFHDQMPEYSFGNGTEFSYVDFFLTGPRNDTTHNSSAGGNTACSLFSWGGNAHNVDYNHGNSYLPSQSVIGAIDSIQFGCGTSHGSGQFDTGTNVKIYGVTYGA